VRHFDSAAYCRTHLTSESASSTDNCSADPTNWLVRRSRSDSTRTMVTSTRPSAPESSWRKFARLKFSTRNTSQASTAPTVAERRSVYNPPLMRHALPLACMLALALPARAQRTVPEPATPGVYNPTVGLAGDADASSIERNPAGLGFLRSWSGVYLHTEVDDQGTIGGRGDGFFFASPLPYLSSLALGAAVQSIRPPTTFPFANEAKLQLAFAWRIVPAFSIGIAYAHLWSDKGPVAGGVDTLDAGLSTRLGPHLAGAVVVHDIPSSSVGGLPLQRVYEPEVAIRPFGTDLVELAASARFGERRGDVDPRFRLWVTPYSGITLKAEMELRRDLYLDGKEENDLRVAIGLQLDLERVGVAGFGRFGTDGGKTRGSGFTLAARISGERYPALWRGLVHLEKVDLGPGLTGRRLVAMLLHLRRLERERDVGGVVVVLGDLDGGWATAEELRAALLRLRHARKHVYVYMTEVTTRSYYVASAGERLYQDPAGGIRLIGLTSTGLYFKGTGDLLGVRADFVKIAEYKSAPEQYTQKGPSEPAKQQRQAMLSDLYRHLTEGIAAARRVSPDDVRRWIDRGPYTAVEAQRNGLVDELRDGDEVEGAIGELLGRHVAIHDPPSAPERARSWEKPRVAVLFVDGDIVDGKSQTIPILNLKMVGLQSLLPALARAREDSRVKAIVLRIDSPGGSALASDLIARELLRTRAVKPVVCSLGDVAASGGYFIAAPCQRIFAAPSTLTGSIGIFTGKFDLSGLAAKLGVTLETTERGLHASMDSLWRPYTDEERALILDKLGYYYGRFVDTVSRGRGLSNAAVEALGRGRVWSGSAAQARGLVDQLGGLVEAVAEAKKLAGLRDDEPVDVDALPEEPSLLSTLAGLLGINLRAESSLPLVAPLFRALPASLLVEPSVPQARLDEELTIQ
jgi:protease-4